MFAKKKVFSPLKQCFEQVKGEAVDFHNEVQFATCGPWSTAFVHKNQLHVFGSDYDPNFNKTYELSESLKMLEMRGSTIFYYTDQGSLWSLNIEQDVPTKFDFDDDEFSWTGIQSISIGTEHLAILNSNGTVSTMGKNKYG